MPRRQFCIHSDSRRLGLSAHPIMHLADIHTPAPTWSPIQWLSAFAFDPVVTIVELKGLIANPAAELRLFDVREPHEYANGKIANAVNIPGLSTV